MRKVNQAMNVVSNNSADVFVGTLKRSIGLLLKQKEYSGAILLFRKMLSLGTLAIHTKDENKKEIVVFNAPDLLISIRADILEKVIRKI